MSTPIIESIAANIATTVDGVKISAGYNQTLHAVRPKRLTFLQDGWDNGDVVILQEESEQTDEPTMYRQWKQYFLLAAFVVDSESATTPIDTRLNQVAADIEKAIMVDRRRGNSTYVADTRIEDREFWYDPEARSSGVSLRVSVTYRYPDGDPYGT